MQIFLLAPFIMNVVTYLIQFIDHKYSAIRNVVQPILFYRYNHTYIKAKRISSLDKLLGNFPLSRFVIEIQDFPNKNFYKKFQEL